MHFMRHKQYGISLIELMLAMTVSLFLMIGLGATYYVMRQNAIARSGLSQLQDQQRIAMTLIANAVQHAGYFSNPLTTTREAVFSTTPTPFTIIGQPLAGSDTTLDVRYQSDSTVPMGTCLGLSSGTTSYIDTFSVSANNTLDCSEVVGNKNAVRQSLVSGVSSMSVVYGVDTDGDGSVNQYQAASTVSATDWRNIKSIQVTLNFINPLAGQPGQRATLPFTRTISLMNTL